MTGNVLGIIDAVGLVLAVISVVMAIRVVIRTEKELDTAVKFLLAMAVILVFANLTSVNDFFGGIVPDKINMVIFHSSRIVALICYMAAMHYLIKITEK